MAGDKIPQGDETRTLGDSPPSTQRGLFDTLGYKPGILSTRLAFTTPLRQRVLVIGESVDEYLLLWFSADTPGDKGFGVEPRRKGERFWAAKSRVEVLL